MAVGGAEGLRHVINIHASNMEDLADSLATDGIGLHATHGHAAILRRMAASMRAEAAVGKTPSRYDDGAMYYASAGEPSGLPPRVSQLLASANVQVPPTGPVSVLELDAAMSAAAMPVAARIDIKRALAALGRLTS